MIMQTMLVGQKHKEHKDKTYGTQQHPNLRSMLQGGLDIGGSLLETKLGDMYALVAIDQCSKWCEARVVVDHDARTTSRFPKDEVIF